MTDKEIRENAERNAKERFSTHKATIVTDTERYLAIDWRREDGGIEYYINFIIDKQRGAFIVSGDLGESIALWYNKLEPSNLKCYITDVDYYIKKIQCASDLYDYSDESVMEDLKATFEADEIFENDEVDFYDYESLGDIYGFNDLEDEVADCINCNHFIPSERLIDILRDFGYSDMMWVFDSRIGRRINGRVHLWQIGFKMACEQLGI